MGCVSSPKHIHVTSIKIVPKPKKYQSQSLTLRKNYIHNKKFFNKIHQFNWTKIVDYLNFQELKEVGKTTKMLNSLVKQHEILTKFFKKKEECIYSNTQDVSLTKLQSFSMLANTEDNSINSDDNDSFCSTSLNTDSSIN